MHIRKLEVKDAPLMLEWMHDKSIVEFLHEDFMKKTLSDAEEFIDSSLRDTRNIHYAICSDEDEYMGTVSLKHLDGNSGELAIVVRKSALTRGYSWYGMEEMLKLAFEKFDLESVYWCVPRRDSRAVRFYKKHNFHEVVDIPTEFSERYKDIPDLIWFSFLKGDVFDERDRVAGCKVLRIKTIPTVNAGELSFFECNHDLDFEIKRFYYISKVPEGTRRGFHAHKKLKQLIFCPYGRVQLILENRNGREEIELSDPSIGVEIDSPTWREMLWLQKDSVLCVAASEYYTETDYIRNYDDFYKYLNSLDS